MTYRKKPVVIEAVRLGWDTWNHVCEFAGVGSLVDNKPEGGWIDPNDPGHIHMGNTPPPGKSVDDMRLGLAIPTLEGVMLAIEGDWIIKGIKGELYACKPDIFEMTYEPTLEPVHA